MNDISRRPLKTCPKVGQEWANIMVEYIDSNNKNHVKARLYFYFVHYTNLNAMMIIQFLMNDASDTFLINMDNKQISLFASKIEPALEAAHDLIVREWVLANGVRFDGKEGDAVEIKDPESGFEKIGTIIAVYKPRASALIQYRDKKEKTQFREFGSEEILKVFKNGSPFDNSPRGGKVGFQSDEFIQAVAA